MINSTLFDVTYDLWEIIELWTTIVAPFLIILGSCLTIKKVISSISKFRAKLKWLKMGKCPKNGGNHPQHKDRELISCRILNKTYKSIIETYFCRKCFGNPHKKYYYYKYNSLNAKNSKKKYLWGIRIILLKIRFIKTNRSKSDHFSIKKFEINIMWNDLYDLFGNIPTKNYADKLYDLVEHIPNFTNVLEMEKADSLQSEDFYWKGNGWTLNIQFTNTKGNFVCVSYKEDTHCIEGMTKNKEVLDKWLRYIKEQCNKYDICINKGKLK